MLQLKTYNPIVVLYCFCFIIYILLFLSEFFKVFIGYHILLNQRQKSLWSRIGSNMLKLLLQPIRLICFISLKCNLYIILPFVITILTFISSMRAIYNLFYIVISRIVSTSPYVYAYTALTSTLIAVTYFPDKTVLWVHYRLNNLLGKLKFNKAQKYFEADLQIYKKILILLRPKLWVYFISIAITAINSLEKISETGIISNALWVQIKPVVFESVLTVIVIDRFINLFKKELARMKEEAKQININKP